MKYKFQITGPFTLLDIDNSNSDYLFLTFSDGFTRKMSKGGKWPPEYAKNLYEKSNPLKGKSVYIKTSQTTDNWPTTKWMCDIHPQDIAEKRIEIASELNPDLKINSTESREKYILVSTATGKSYYANAELIVDYFSREDEFLDFCHSFEKDFVSSWVAKNARNKGLPNEVKRIRIGGLGNKTKRNGFRVVVAEVKTKDTSEAFKFFHILRVDDKSDREDYLTDAETKEIGILKKELEKKYSNTQINWL